MSAPVTDVTRDRFERTLDRHPELAHHGFGLYRGPGMKRAHRKPHFERGRAQLRGAYPAVAEVAAWLQAHVAPTKTATAYSYDVKHVAEESIGRYVSNGELIAAALLAGYVMRQTDGPNALFGMSRRDLDAARRVSA